MISKWRLAVFSLFLIGMVLIGMVGTSASLTFLWPAYGVLGLAALLSVGLILEESPFPLPRAASIALLALCGYVLVRAADSPVSYFAREDAALVVLAFLAYGLFLILTGTAASRRRLVEALALIVGIHLAFALIQALFLPTFWLIPGYGRTITDRPGGLFNHPDHFGGFLAMLVPLWLAMAVYSRRSRPVRISAVILAVGSGATVVTGGSGPAILALAAGSAAFLALSLVILHRRINTRSKRAGWRLLAAGSLVLLVVALVAAAPLGRLIDRTVLTKSGELSLPLVWKSGFAQIAESPLLGTGSRTSYLYTRLHREEALDSSSTEPEFIHNEFLQIVADYGLVGLALLLVMLALHAHHGFRFLRAYAAFPPAPGAVVPKSDHLAFVTGAMASLAALGVLCCFDFVLHLPAYMLVGALFLAVLAVPDPMAAALKSTGESRLFPGGWLIFSNRALVFGCGLAMTLLGAIFSRSEYHYEMARRSFEADRSGFQHLRHLHTARQLDPKNPYLFSLSAHAQVAAILPELPEPARREALEKADFYFNHARNLYPQDIFAAIGHAAVLDELGRHGEALTRLREAREMAPHYGNLILAEGEYHLRHGRIVEAEKAFSEAVGARAFRDTAAAQQGLRTLTEWKLIAEQNGIDWRIDPDPRDTPPLLAGTYESRSPADAQVAERDLAGRSPDMDDEGPFAPRPIEAPSAEKEPVPQRETPSASDPAPVAVVSPDSLAETNAAPERDGKSPASVEAASVEAEPLLFHGPPKPAPSKPQAPPADATPISTPRPSPIKPSDAASLYDVGSDFAPMQDSDTFYFPAPDLFPESITDGEAAPVPAPPAVLPQP